MHSLATAPGNLLVNGKFLPGLWTRLAGSPTGTAIPCPIYAETFAADRWRVRYASPSGGEVTQACSSEILDAVSTATILEIRGGSSVEQKVFVGQNIEADEALNFRRLLRFSAWVKCQHPRLASGTAALVVGNPRTVDLFDSSVETVQQTLLPAFVLNRWTRIEATVKASAFRPTGLRVELAFSAEFLSDPAARVLITDASLSCASGPLVERPPALERFLARRFFQRHDGTNVNAIGRALTSNPHEMFFQFSFPEMRAIPACTISQDNADLCVYSADGQPQSGFTYDVTFGSRSSVIIRATKLRHQLRDGYLAFRGYRGAILLNAEL